MTQDDFGSNGAGSAEGDYGGRRSAGPQSLAT